MQSFPTLEPEARQLLEILVRNKSIDGSSLMKQTGRSPAELQKLIGELLNLQLIEVGGAVTPEELPFARIGIRPSAIDYTYGLLQNKPA